MTAAAATACATAGRLQLGSEGERDTGVAFGTQCVKVYAGSHLSLGLNALVREPASVVAAERQLGSLVLGLGAQPPGLGIFGESRVRTAIHTDLIAEGITLQVGATALIENGRLRAVEALSSAERDPWQAD